MASLKEVKNRIASVGGTQKITQARQMVSSAQLHHAQSVLENAIMYKESLDRLASGLLSLCMDYETPYTTKNTSGPIAMVLMASNSGMCGSFNANMIKELQSLPALYPDDKLIFFPIGKKIREAIEHAGLNIGTDPGTNLDALAGRTSYEEIAETASLFMELYRSRKVKRVEMLYYHYQSTAIQEIKETTLLPYSFSQDLVEKSTEEKDDFILEPSKEDLLDTLIPMLLKTNLYTTIMDSQTSEHAARTMAMQLATENADEILGGLQLTYNKLRQQNITSELLDIIGSSFA